MKEILSKTLTMLRADWEQANRAYQADPTPARLGALRAYDAAINTLIMGLAILQDERTEALSRRRSALADLRGALARAGILVGGE